VAVFHDLGPDDERALLEREMCWQQAKYDAGYGAITWSPEYGGAGLPTEYEHRFREVELEFAAPPGHETLTVTTRLVAPTVRLFGTDEQRERFVRRFLRAEQLCCQLFSEPGAGSDLAGVATRAVRDGDRWLVNGQKVWSSGAAFSGWGELIARTDPDVAKHEGLTAFLVPLDAPGVEIRPIRQMSGGSSFSEVFLTDVRIGDDLRLGPVGSGWKVALTTLGFERGGSAGARRIGGTWAQVLDLARRAGALNDPTTLETLAELYTELRITQLLRQRAHEVARSGAPPGPEASIVKVRWARDLRRISDVVADLLGPALVSDTGDWGTFAWTEYVLGAPGYRIAGGSDEIQLNILGERVLGLPPEPRVDRGIPWRDVPR
jgi:alkylation response protein AidB-like acyl-CoA dehydrogenase